MLSLILSAAAVGSAAIDLEGVVGFRVSCPPNAAASAHATVSLRTNGYSLEGSTSLSVLPDRETRSALAFSVERGGLTLTSRASFAGMDAQCESITVELTGLSTSLSLREAAPKIGVDMSATLGTVVMPDASPYASLVATLSVDEHWLRCDSSPAVIGCIALYHRPTGDGRAEADLRVSALFFADIVPYRVSRVALDARLDPGRAVIMGTILHSHSIPFSVDSSIRTADGPLSLSVWASFIPEKTTPLRLGAQAEYELPAL